MADKHQTQVVIGGKIYTLSGYESEEYLQRVAAYMNLKMSELRKLDAYRRYSAETKALLMDLNIADDYFKAKDKVETLEAELSEREEELGLLQRDFAEVRAELDTLKKSK